MSTRNIADTLQDQTRFSRFREAARRTGLETQFRSAGPFTVFAPLDSAFDALDAETRARFATDDEFLRTVLEYHVLRASLRARELRQGQAKTVGGTSIRIGATDDGVTIDHANVVAKDIHCANGLIHAIDAVIIPGYSPPLAAGAENESAWSGRKRVVTYRTR